MFEDFTIEIKNFTKDKASVKEVKTLKNPSLRWQKPSKNLLLIIASDTRVK